MGETLTEDPQKVKDQAGIIGEHIIGPIFIHGYLTVENTFL